MLLLPLEVSKFISRGGIKDEGELLLLLLMFVLLNLIVLLLLLPLKLKSSSSSSLFWSFLSVTSIFGTVTCPGPNLLSTDSTDAVDKGERTLHGIFVGAPLLTDEIC